MSLPVKSLNKTKVLQALRRFHSSHLLMLIGVNVRQDFLRLMDYIEGSQIGRMPNHRELGELIEGPQEAVNLAIAYMMHSIKAFCDFNGIQYVVMEEQFLGRRLAIPGGKETAQRIVKRFRDLCHYQLFYIDHDDDFERVRYYVELSQKATLPPKDVFLPLCPGEEQYKQELVVFLRQGIRLFCEINQIELVDQLIPGLQKSTTDPEVVAAEQAMQRNREKVAIKKAKDQQSMTGRIASFF